MGDGGHDDDDDDDDERVFERQAPSSARTLLAMHPSTTAHGTHDSCLRMSALYAFLEKKEDIPSLIRRHRYNSVFPKMHHARKTPGQMKPIIS